MFTINSRGKKKCRLVDRGGYQVFEWFDDIDVCHATHYDTLVECYRVNTEIYDELKLRQSLSFLQPAGRLRPFSKLGWDCARVGV